MICPLTQRCPEAWDRLVARDPDVVRVQELTCNPRAELLCLDVADRLGVSFRILDEDHRTFGGWDQGFSGGPEDGWAKSGEVLWTHGAPWVWLLHEISHAVWATEEYTPEDYSEGRGQDQWEYHVVQTLFPYRQRMEHVEFINNSFRFYAPKAPFGRWRTFMKNGATDNYRDCRRLAEWRKGRELAQKMGALDENRKPTWRRPDWTKLNEADLKWLTENDPW